ncbi:unnamed protein product [Caenorhabditis sp. 36 PRJEB53466]|nr:unnamed protein product [Caenorhabditis sp. 36 PRJEB53466]
MQSLTLFLIFHAILLGGVFNYDCYKFSKTEFATIKSCKFGCEYEYKIKGGHNLKEFGGCSDEHSTPGCRQKSSKIVCMCAENHCNKQGYDMDTSSEEH